VRRALAEDLGHGDITTTLTVDPSVRATARIICKQDGILSGLAVAEAVFARLDSNIGWHPGAEDGDHVCPGGVVACISGPAASILQAERVALNFLQHMSGVASLTKRFVLAVENTNAQIVDTRKSMPGLRALEKYAVVCGGGRNHRFGLDDGILIKDNHVAAAGGIGPALARVRERAPHGLRIEIEIDRLDQIGEAIAGGAEIILLDNMGPEMLAQAVDMIGGRARTEASGGVTLESVAAIAEAGVDLISVGRLTHSAPALDFALDLEVAP
jgi:nicotinate-nucleotide pyrophosphorylase (carboxylating)